MVRKSSIGAFAALAMVAALLVAPTASAQGEAAQVVGSSLSVEKQSATSDTLSINSSTFIIYTVTWTIEPGGFSPTGGELVVTPTLASAPEWATLGALQEATFSLPTGPDAGQRQMSSEEFSITLEIGEAPYGSSESLSLTWAVTPASDMGTIQTPDAPADTTYDLPIEDEPEQLPGEGGTGGGGTGGGGGPGGDDGGDDTEEGPAPAPMAALLALVGFAAIRRRRD